MTGPSPAPMIQDHVPGASHPQAHPARRGVHDRDARRVARRHHALHAARQAQERVRLLLDVERPGHQSTDRLKVMVLDMQALGKRRDSKERAASGGCCGVLTASVLNHFKQQMCECTSLQSLCGLGCAGTLLPACRASWDMHARLTHHKLLIVATPCSWMSALHRNRDQRTLHQINKNTCPVARCGHLRSPRSAPCRSRHGPATRQRLPAPRSATPSSPLHAHVHEAAVLFIISLSLHKAVRWRCTRRGHGHHCRWLHNSALTLLISGHKAAQSDLQRGTACPTQVRPRHPQRAWRQAVDKALPERECDAL